MDKLLRRNLKIEHSHAQCYNGASSMSGAKKRVAKVLSDEEPCAIFTHVYGHALDIALSDCETVQGYEEYQFRSCCRGARTIG